MQLAASEQAWSVASEQVSFLFLITTLFVMMICCCRWHVYYSWEVPAGEVVEAKEGDGDEDGQGRLRMKLTLLEGQ